MYTKCSALACLGVFLSVVLTTAIQAQDPSLVGWWRLDNGAGTVATDSSGNGNHGNLVGTLEWVEGVMGGALHFDGATAQVDIPAADNLAVINKGDFTCMIWLKTDALDGANQYAFQQADLNGTGRSWLFIAGDNEIRTFVGNGTTGSAFYVEAQTWYHAAFVVTEGGATDTIQMYVNGQAQGAAGQRGMEDCAGAFIVGAHKNLAADTRWTGVLDDLRVYTRALTAEEIQKVMQGMPELATDPVPADTLTDVPQDVTLAWTPGESAVTHDVYLGATFDDVNDASRADPMGVLASQGQASAAYESAGLEYGQTYYWRIDEVNAPPDGTIFKGQVWSFTIEPFGYPIANVTATASSAQAGMGPENVVNGSGLDMDGRHSTEATHMWLSAGELPNWIRFELDKVYKLHELWVWNSNQLIESFLGFGARDVTVEFSLDGSTWTQLEAAPELARATGLSTYTANTVVDFGGVTAKFVKLTIDQTWGGVAPQTGLSEVRFFYIPVQAREPEPGSATMGVSVAADLHWRPGREAVSHEVYFGADANALTLLDTVAEHSYTPASLDFGATYFWKINEVGNAGTYEGNVWSFTTQEYATVDDFESYNDDDNRIYDSWIDGWVNNTGSQVGYDVSPFAEKTIIHAGKQSMPLAYDNTAAPFLSEAERTFDTARNWTTNGADSLVVHFRGLAPGFAETASGSILMNAVGTDIWNNTDQFRFAYKTLNGDGTMVARVESIHNSNVWAKGGVMIRQSIEPGSTHAFMPITPGGSSGGNGASFQRRLAANGASTNNDSTTVVAAPSWVKIERSGNNFTGSISPDGVAWTQLGTAQTITMANPVLIGLALCSHDPAIATSAEFSNVSATGNVTGTWQLAEIGIEPAFGGVGNSIEPMYVTITDSSGKSKTATNPDTAATARTSWQQWKIPLSEFTSAGVKMNAVRTMAIGVGNKAAPTKGGAGILYIDDIAFGHPAR